jgi:hypothetical protein
MIPKKLGPISNRGSVKFNRGSVKNNRGSVKNNRGSVNECPPITISTYSGIVMKNRGT